MDIYREVQMMLVDDYRASHPEAAIYTDEEIAMINPVTMYDIDAYIDVKIDALQREIDYNIEIINDAKTYYQEVTELRSENVYLSGLINALQRTREALRLSMGEVLDEPKGR